MIINYSLLVGWTSGDLKPELWCAESKLQIYCDWTRRAWKKAKHFSITKMTNWNIRSIFPLQKFRVACQSTITLCPCGCETGLDDNYQAHGNSQFSLIGDCSHTRFGLQNFFILLSLPQETVSWFEVQPLQASITWPVDPKVKKWGWYQQMPL